MINKSPRAEHPEAHKIPKSRHCSNTLPEDSVSNVDLSIFGFGGVDS